MSGRAVPHNATYPPPILENKLSQFLLPLRPQLILSLLCTISDANAPFLARQSETESGRRGRQGTSRVLRLARYTGLQPGPFTSHQLTLPVPKFSKSLSYIT
ncbi:hypothetical protein J6590_067825 [Homalodisca vitripennis]|nr:hypothetical protein J6590_067825 [Homalodisca vitripennis]